MGIGAPMKKLESIPTREEDRLVPTTDVSNMLEDKEIKRGGCTQNNWQAMLMNIHNRCIRTVSCTDVEHKIYHTFFPAAVAKPF